MNGTHSAAGWNISPSHLIPMRVATVTGIVITAGPSVPTQTHSSCRYWSWLWQQSSEVTWAEHRWAGRQVWGWQEGHRHSLKSPLPASQGSLGHLSLCNEASQRVEAVTIIVLSIAVQQEFRKVAGDRVFLVHSTQSTPGRLQVHA